MSFIGWLFLKVAGRAMPGFPASAVYAMAFAFVLSTASILAYGKGADGKAVAVALAHAQCQHDIDISKAASAESLAHLLMKIDMLEADAIAPKTPEQEKAACKKSKLCRDFRK